MGDETSFSLQKPSLTKTLLASTQHHLPPISVQFSEKYIQKLHVRCTTVMQKLLRRSPSFLSAKQLNLMSPFTAALRCPHNFSSAAAAASFRTDPSSCWKTAPHRAWVVSKEDYYAAPHKALLSTCAANSNLQRTSAAGNPDLLTIPGVGPRNLRKLVDKGFDGVAQLKQLYKDKVS